jgi:hypothetical protein
MLVACRLAGLSALETYYAGVRARTQFGPTTASQQYAHAAMADRWSVERSAVRRGAAVGAGWGGRERGGNFPIQAVAKAGRKLLYVQHFQSQRFSPRILTGPLPKLG